MLKHRYPRSSVYPLRGSILDDDSNLMHYQGGGAALQRLVSKRDDYGGVDSVSGDDYKPTNSNLPRRRSESDLLKSYPSNTHCYDEIGGALFNDSNGEISPYCVGPVMEPRSKRFGSTASRISQDSGAFCDEALVPPPLPPLKPRSSRRRYANIEEFEASPPPLPPRKAHRGAAPPPPPPARNKSPSPLHLNLNLPGLNPVGRRTLSKDIRESSNKTTLSRRRRTLHSFDSNKENNVASSPPSVSTKKKFKIFGSKTPLSITSEEQTASQNSSSSQPSPRRRKIFRRSLINTSLRKKKILDPSLSTPVSHRRRSSLMFGGSNKNSTKGNTPVISPLPLEESAKSEEIIQSSKDEDFSHCIQDALKHGLPIIPFQSRDDKVEDRIPPPICCCHSLGCCKSSSSWVPSQSKFSSSSVKKSLDNIVGEAQKEMEDEEKRLLNIMMKHADLLLTPRVIRAALQKNKSKGSQAGSSESELSEEEISEYLEMNRLPGRPS